MGILLHVGTDVIISPSREVNGLFLKLYISECSVQEFHYTCISLSTTVYYITTVNISIDSILRFICVNSPNFY